MQARVLLVDFVADSRSAGPSIRENFTDVPSIRDSTYAREHVRVRSSDFRKLPTGNFTNGKGMTRLIVDSPPTREIDSQRRLLRGKCNYADDYARPVTMHVFPFAYLDTNPCIVVEYVVYNFHYNNN